MDRGLVAQNVARNRARGKKANGRAERHVETGRDIPTPAEIRAITGHLAGLADPRFRPLLLTAIFTGLRASELRGLRWADVNLDRHELHVRQRADMFGTIGRPKSKTGTRTIPLPPLVANTLREWKLKAGQGELVFPGRGERPLYYNAIQTAWHVVQIAVGIVNGEGKPKYSGLHALRHFYASWCINRRADGGLELPIKVVQARLVHRFVETNHLGGIHFT
jgi:integrase